MSHVFALLIGTLAFAGLNGAPRVSPFAVCRNRPGADADVRPWPARCQSPQDQKAERLRRDATEIARTQQLAAATRIARARIDEQLDLFIDSRTKLLVCMDSETEDCRARVNRLTDMLTTQAKRLRILLALSAPEPEGLDARNIDRVPHEIRLPVALGGRRLPPLSPEEKLEIRTAREKLLSRMRYPDGDVTETCQPRPEPNDPCRRFQTWRLNKKFELHQAAGVVAEVLAHQLPLVTQVDEVPVTKEAARKILRNSQDVLREWKAEVARDHVSRPEALVHRYPRLFEPILREHPEYCDGVSTALVRARTKGELKDLAWMAAQAGTAIAGCWFVGGAVCTGVGTGWSLWHLKDTSWKAGVLRERYENAGSVDAPGEYETANALLPYSDVKSAQRDHVVAIAATALSATFLTRSVGKALDPDRIPSRPWSEQLKTAMEPEHLDPGKTETLIMKAGRKVERAARRNANEAALDRRWKVRGTERPIGEMEEGLAELYSPAP